MEKELSLFCKNKSRPDGYGLRCKECHSRIERERREREPEAAAAKDRARYAKSPKKYESNKKWNAENVDKVREYEATRAPKRKVYRRIYNKKYYLLNTDKMKAQSAEQRRLNPEYHRQGVIRWRIKNPARFRMHLMRREKRAKEAGPVSQESLQRVLDQARCTYCDRLLTREPSPRQRTLDHILPLARGGTNHSGNHAAACRTCNFSKHDRILFYEWLPPGLVRDQVFTREEVEVYVLEEVARQRAALVEEAEQLSLAAK